MQKSICAFRCNPSLVSLCSTKHQTNQLVLDLIEFQLTNISRMQPTLLVLAAGMGSRFGGLKQLEPMGPSGETLLDYSIRHAIAAGFKKVVFVIRKDFAGAFKEQIGAPYVEQIEIAYAYQELEDIPEPFALPEGRSRPWGTAHAIRAARDLVKDPFIAINADDYYGADAYQQITNFLQNPKSSGVLQTAMVGYPVANTLSPHGTVNRGICKIEGGYLQSVEEHTDIQQTNDGSIYGKNLAGKPVTLSPDCLVSMNFWAFSPDFFQTLETEFTHFLEAHSESPKAECYIPTVVDTLIQSGQASCQVYPSTGDWFGVTYPQDKAFVQKKLLSV